MSSAENSGPVEKKGVGKILSRMKTVLRKSDGSKRFSLSGRGATTTPAAAGPSTTTAAESAPDKPAVEAKEQKPVPEGPKVIRIMRSQIDAERANRLSERLKLPKIEPFELPSKPDREALRIEKPIRVRIHVTCHNCQAAFGGSKVCPSCQHPRCSRCPRFPSKKTKAKAEGAAAKEKEAPAGGVHIEPDPYWGLMEKYVLTMPSRTGGQPLVRKKPMQRIRRTCHECSTLFQAGSKICSNCDHVRCADCPRDPAKKRKYPDGYPGDAYSATSLRPLKYSCHHCLKVFPPIPHPQSPEGLAAAASSEPPPPPPTCVRCGHAKCSECARAPIVKEEPAVDPEIMKSVEAKLAALNLGASTGEQEEVHV